METSHYISVDLGATSGRVMLATFDGIKVTLTELTRFANPMIPVGGHLYWDLPALYNEILRGLQKAASEGINPVSIGIDTWGCDFAFFGADGQLIGLPHCYRDSHTDGAVERFFEKMSAEELYGRTGIQFMNFNSLFQLDTMHRNGSSALAAADKILFIPDALAYMLTGHAVTEYTVASTSQMLNSAEREFDTALLEKIGIPRERFGEMTQPATVIGTLTEQVQQATGLGAVKVVAVAGHDTASAVIAVPATTRHFAYLSCGTWSLLGIESDEPIINEESFHQNFTNEGGIDGKIRFLKNICGLWIFEQCRTEWKDAPKDVGELVALCATTSFDSLIDPDAADFTHPASMCKAIDDYCQRTGQAVPTTPAEYCRCIFRSLALRYREVLDIFRTFAPVDALNIIGGGSRNKYLMQYTANAVGMTVTCGPTECTALGNALVQIRAEGRVQGIEQMRAISAASTQTITYEPCESEEWNAAYQRFIEIKSKNN